MLILAALLAAPAAADPIEGPRPQPVDDRFVADPPVAVDSWVEGLDTPWSLVFLPDGRALVSERPGRIRLIEADGTLRAEPYASFDDIGTSEGGIVDFFVGLVAGGEAGLMGLALHPGFPDPPWLYAMYTYDREGGLGNRVVRLEHRGDRAVLDKVIVDAIPGGRNHDGGRLGFGPDGMLYVATGETFQAELAQDLSSLGGKILRVAPDGSIPADNPFDGSPVWSYGHRNPQGLAWHPDTGELFASEHGPSGEFGLGAHDEVNVIRKGANYGWPEAVGAPGEPGYVDPVAAWTERTTPPAGIAFWRGALYVATLGSEALLRLEVERRDDRWRVTGIERWFTEQAGGPRFGRLRDAVVGPDGALYVTTSNRDGRGSPRDADDRILRLTPKE